MNTSFLRAAAPLTQLMIYKQAPANIIRKRKNLHNYFSFLQELKKGTRIFWTWQLQMACLYFIIEIPHYRYTLIKDIIKKKTNGR